MPGHLPGDWAPEGVSPWCPPRRGVLPCWALSPGGRSPGVPSRGLLTAVVQGCPVRVPLPSPRPARGWPLSPPSTHVQPEGLMEALALRRQPGLQALVWAPSSPWWPGQAGWSLPPGLWVGRPLGGTSPRPSGGRDGSSLRGSLYRPCPPGSRHLLRPGCGRRPLSWVTIPQSQEPLPRWVGRRRGHLSINSQRRPQGGGIRGSGTQLAALTGASGMGPSLPMEAARGPGVSSHVPGAPGPQQGRCRTAQRRGRVPVKKEDGK